MNTPEIPRVVIVGAGFGGLTLARALRRASVEVLLIDRQNYHTFQPLLYQVATAGLEPEEIAHAVRGIFQRQKNFSFRLGTVVGVDEAAKAVLLKDGDRMAYDYLVLATGLTTNFFGIEGAEAHSFPLKSLPEAVALRSHIIRQFEQADRDRSLLERGALTFVVVGGGPTGVEMAGALVELFQMVLRKDFPRLPLDRARVVLVEASPRLLGAFHETSQAYALKKLARRGVEVRLDEPVVSVEADAVTLQAVSAVGQSRLMRSYNELLERHGLVGGQVLLAPLDFMVRKQYLHARSTLERLLELGVVPIVNENDAIADDEIRFGDNDRLAALVAHLVGAELMVLLTDTAGVLTADPRLDEAASLIEEIVEIDHELEALAGGAGERGSGGMASKVAAAKIAAWSGVRTVIADAGRPGVLAAAASGANDVGTVVLPRDRRLGARKLWIAFAVGASGTIVVDAGARRALIDEGRSLLAAGVESVEGGFERDQAVEVATPDGKVFAKGLVRVAAGDLRGVAGQRTDQLPEGMAHEVIHRDDLVVLP